MLVITFLPRESQAFWHIVITCGTAPTNMQIRAFIEGWVVCYPCSSLLGSVCESACARASTASGDGEYGFLGGLCIDHDDC